MNPEAFTALTIAIAQCAGRGMYLSDLERDAFRLGFAAGGIWALQIAEERIVGKESNT